MLMPTHGVGGHQMIGQPFRVDWRREDTPEALKAAYQSERDVTLRSRLHEHCGCCAQDGGCLRWHQQWGSTIGRYRRGWAGIKMEAWTKWCPTKWEAEAHRAIWLRRKNGVDRSGVERTIQNGRPDQRLGRVGVRSELQAGRRLRSASQIEMFTEGASWCS